MKHRWLTLLVTAFLSVVVFSFFWVRLQPVWTKEKAQEQSAAMANQQNITAPTVTFVNPKKGAAEPKITIVEFGDFQCQPCKDLANNLDVLVRTKPEVQIVWKDMPNESAHKLAVSAAMAARCAANQGKFWEYHDALYDRQVLLDENSFASLASEIGLDTQKFQTCFDNQETLPMIRKDFEEATALAITATPILFIGEERLTGLLTTEELIAWVNKLMPTE